MESSWPIWLTLLLPALGAALMMFLPSDRTARNSAVLTTVLTALASLLFIPVLISKEPASFHMTGFIPWVSTLGLEFSVGVDSIATWLVLLTTFLMPIIVFGSFSAVTERQRAFYGWLLLLETAMIGTFVARDLIFFYICFEFTLIPLYFLIGIFGSKNRLEAARVFFLYTFTGSMLTFAGLLYVAYFNTTLPTSAFAGAGEWTFNIGTLTAAAQSMSASQQMCVLLALLAGFAVKVPLFPVHTWLPLAHTEAPTAGSVILAGVLLKLGTYGLLRFALPMTPVATLAAAPWIGALATIGILYAGLICWVQTDIKKLVAYSSVSHLGFCVLGMFALNVEGISGSVLYMINHGLSTGALFLCIGMIYERFHTREFRDISGLARVMPVWATFFVFFAMASVGLPGLNGFVSEFLALLGTFKASTVLGPTFAVFAGVGMIIGAMYILYMVGKVVWGPLKVPGHGGGHGHGHGHDDHGHAAHDVKDLNTREVLVLLALAIPCLWLGLSPGPVLETVGPAASKTVAIYSNSKASETYVQQQKSTVTIAVTGVGDAQEHIVNQTLRREAAAQVD
jgi:NADH-quinone oxidoreductase subunit M